jgi:tetratricopeptide (TPR) repeat protein
MHSTEHSTVARSRLLARLAVFAALLAGLALYLPSLKIELLADDYVFLSRARTLPLLSWLGSTGCASYYRPVSRQLYFWGMSHRFGPGPFPFHVFSLLLYLACAGLLAALASRLGGAKAGTLAALLFVGQHAGSVLTGWACCTQDLFGLLFTIAAIGFHLRGWRGAALASLALGLLSKETAGVVPFAILALESPPTPGRKPAGTFPALRAAMPYFVVLAVWAALYVSVFQNLPGKLPEAPVLDLHARGADMLRGVGLSLMGLVNLDESRLALPALEEDRLRLAGGVALGILALVLAWRSPATPPAGRRSGAPDPSLTRLGLVWAGVSLVPLALIGHRWSAYDNAMVGAGAALAGAGWLRARPAPARALAAFLLISGPCADAVGGGESQAGLHSLWSLASLRRLSEFVTGLRTGLLRAHPKLEPGTHVLLANIPPMALLSLYESDALRAWYADTTLVMSTVNAELDSDRPPARFFVMNCDTRTRPYTWRVEGPEWSSELNRLGRAQRGKRPAEFLSLLGSLRALPEWNNQTPVLRGKILHDAGQAASDLRDYPRADSFFAESSQADPANADSHFERGLLALLLNRNEQADSELSQALALRPGSPKMLYALGVAHGRLRRADTADLIRQSLAAGLEEPQRSAALHILESLAGATPGRPQP